MPNPILELIKLNATTEEIQRFVARNKEMVPLFVPLNELNNKSLFEHLMLYGKFYYWALENFITSQIVNFQEVNLEGKNLMQLLVKNNDFTNFQYLLLAGQQPTEEVYINSNSTLIGDFLRYKPGRNNPTVFELSIKRKPNIQQLHNLIFDFYETTDAESSTAELSETEEFTPEQTHAYNTKQANVIKKYNATSVGAESLSFVAARGVHFVQKHFSKSARNFVLETKHKPHTTYSFSTLSDSGYQADDEPDEHDEKIVRTHRRNMKFIETLKDSPDKKEKKTGHRAPPAARNNRTFENLFWREIQVYINSYDSLFNLQGIRINFLFESTNNPHVSLSWKTEIAGMYAGGVRFGWKRGERLDPHYRRYDGKPKHPNIGYIDLYEFPLDYVRVNGVDRLLAYNAGKIDLPNTFLAEAELIFHSMIPKKYNLRRHVVVVPSFNKITPVSKIDEHYFGMKGAASYTRARNGLIKSMDKKLKDSEYQEWVTKRTEHAVEAQSKLIDKSIDLMLFKRGKVRAFDHGNAVSVILPTPNR